MLLLKNVFMVISSYQINNVLRVYGEQLRRGRISNRKRSTDTNSPDKISISVRAERKTIIDDTTSKPKKKIWDRDSMVL